MNKIIEYLKTQYKPSAILLYGSYSNGTNNLNSDFDAMVIVDSDMYYHDTSIIDGIQLDVFVYSQSRLERVEDFSQIIQIWDSKVVHDTDGFGVRLRGRVQTYIEEYPQKSREEKEDLRSWCNKMAARTERQDAEGLFRWHWLLVDSLEIYCNVRDIYYFGPKKSILKMEEQDLEGYRLYAMALRERESLEAWIDYIFDRHI